ncbi:amino acid transporter AVT6C-like [Zingiber officinale]|uniref:Amino acid transporter transmembrane domain-containing protein n=1 Tax=Zingiber officinale TaxID=94328 RepID=A0A8J5H0Y4_ZINOF|nr:amino acid transporter AVT6C-like [Zingiber officinale]KAG6513149.1 hypothetical protein ZIOFF_023457 [Zingiber officinale]
MTDILSNFDRDTGSAFGSLLNDVVRLSYVLHLVLVFPLLFFSLRINVDELLFPKSSHLSSDARRFTLLTAALLGSVYLGSVLFPSIWTLFQFIGSTTAVCISLIFPAALVLRQGIHGKAGAFGQKSLRNQGIHGKAGAFGQKSLQNQGFLSKSSCLSMNTSIGAYL